MVITFRFSLLRSLTTALIILSFIFYLAISNISVGRTEISQEVKRKYLRNGREKIEELPDAREMKAPPLKERVNANCDEKEIIAKWKKEAFGGKQDSMMELLMKVNDIKNSLDDALKVKKKRTAFAAEISKVRDKADAILKEFDPSHAKSGPALAKTNKFVCPESYTSSTEGYPFFYTGWKIEKCQNVPRFSEVLSITMNLMDRDESFMSSRLVTILKEISTNYTGANVHIASKHQIPKTQLKGIDLVLNFYSDAVAKSTPGAVWNFLVSQVKTPYVLIAENINFFLAVDARLERLVREVDDLGVNFVGAAARDQFGHWSTNCLQSEMRNYTLKYTYGYHRSAHECVYCDSVTGPFVAKTDYLKRNSFDDQLAEEVLFFDYFAKQKEKLSKAVVCPDSMFYVYKNNTALRSKSTWLSFAKKHILSRIILAGGDAISFTCDQLNHGCSKVVGTALSHCCLQELADLVKTFMKTCEENNIICELQEGTLLGAVKLGKVLPWERDADLTFLSGNFSTLTNLKKAFSDKGYSLSVLKELWCCVDNRKAGGIGMLHSTSWHAELYGQHLMDTEKLHWAGLPPTKILFDGTWVAVPRNPGLYARNRYGHEIYRHAEHWMTLGHETGWSLYKTSKFSQCHHPGHHSCLDQYSVDGNIQFQEAFT